MIRFIDLTEAYFTHPDHSSPVCAFLCTSSDVFFKNGGTHLFHDMEEIEEHKQGDRMAALVPEGFFEEDTCHALFAMKALEYVKDYIEDHKHV